MSTETIATRPAPPALPPPLVKRFLDYLFIECGLAGATVEAYRRDLCEFWNHLEQRQVAPADIFLDDIQTHVMALHDRGLGVASIARHLASTRMFLRFLFAERVLRRDVASLIDSPKKWRYLPKVLQYRQVDALLNAPDPTDDYYLRNRAILELLYATGMRVSEMTHLTIGQVNLDVGYLRCRGKGGKERIIPIGGPALAAVRTYVEHLRPVLLRDRSGDAVFLSRSGRPLDRTSIWRLIRKHAAQAGLKGVSPHTMRHCFATHLLAGGADLRVVQELLGHADVTTTQVYTHVDASRLKQVHQRFHPRQ